MHLQHAAKWLKNHTKSMEKSCKRDDQCHSEEMKFYGEKQLGGANECKLLYMVSLCNDVLFPNPL